MSSLTIPESLLEPITRRAYDRGFAAGWQAAMSKVKEVASAGATPSKKLPKRNIGASAPRRPTGTIAETIVSFIREKGSVPSEGFLAALKAHGAGDLSKSSFSNTRKRLADKGVIEQGKDGQWRIKGEGKPSSKGRSTRGSTLTSSPPQPPAVATEGDTAGGSSGEVREGNLS